VMEFDVCVLHNKITQGERADCTALGCKMERKEVENYRKKKKGNRMGWEAFIQFQARLGKAITRKQRDQLTWCSA
jgi:hypothetical protein